VNRLYGYVLSMCLFFLAFVLSGSMLVSMLG
jgi:hypothetical protein